MDVCRFDGFARRNDFRLGHRCPSGTKVGFKTQGELGEVVSNPYDIAPLTSVIRNGGYVLLDAHVRIVPKKNGQTIEYDVGPTALRTHGGIPVFGLYATTSTRWK